MKSDKKWRKRPVISGPSRGWTDGAQWTGQLRTTRIKPWTSTVKLRTCRGLVWISRTGRVLTLCARRTNPSHEEALKAATSGAMAVPSSWEGSLRRWSSQDLVPVEIKQALSTTPNLTTTTNVKRQNRCGAHRQWPRKWHSLAKRITLKTRTVQVKCSWPSTKREPKCLRTHKHSQTSRPRILHTGPEEAWRCPQDLLSKLKARSSLAEHKKQRP